MQSISRSQIAQIVLIAGMFIAAAVAWPSAPQRMPVHWNLAGEVDRYGGRFEGLLLLPLVALGTFLLLTFLPRLDPGRANYARFAGVYNAICLSILAFLAVLYTATLLSAYGIRVDMTRLMSIALGALFFVIGVGMGKIRPNWFCGIRTPWTLTSRLSWTKTHRQGGWLFIAAGILMFVAGVVGAAWLLIAASCAMAAGAIWLVVYSYLVWRSDSERNAAQSSAM